MGKSRDSFVIYYMLIARLPFRVNLITYLSPMMPPAMVAPAAVPSSPPGMTPAMMPAPATAAPPWKEAATDDYWSIWISRTP